MQAQAIFDLVPKGNYVIIKGNSADANADFLRAGAEKVIGDAVTAGDIKIVGETYTDNWDPANAQTEMEQFLTAENNDIQAVLSRERRHGRWRHRRPRRTGPRRPGARVGPGRRRRALNRVALGTQAVDVWKDARELGKAAGEAAIALCANPDPSAVERRCGVHHAWWQRPQLDPADPDPDHPGQPRRRRSTPDGSSQADALRGRRGRLRGSLPLIVI